MATQAAPLPLGSDLLDRNLGGGLPASCLHEITGSSAGAAAIGFAACLLARFSTRGAVMWIAVRAGQLYAPGLAGLGLDPNRLIVVEPPSRALRLWALAEAVRLPGLAAVVAELDAVDFTASRRLQLAAARSGVTAFLLAEEDRAPTHREATAARTRWRVTTMTSAVAIGVGRPRWRLELLRGPSAASGTWIVEPTHDGFRHPALASATATSDTAPRAGAVAALLRDRAPRARVG